MSEYNANKKTSSKSIIIIGIILIVVLVVAGVLYSKLSSGAEISDEPVDDGKILMMSEDFVVTDSNGVEVNFKDYYGKPIILNFWASWCGPCKSEMPTFEEMYKQYGDKINFLMVNVTDGVRETVDTSSNYVADSGYTFPVYYDYKTANDLKVYQSAVIEYGIWAMPTTYFINEDGYIENSYQGAIDDKTLKSEIEKILE